MRLGVLPMLAAAPLFLVACSGDDNPSEDNSPFIPLNETSTESDEPPESDAEEFGVKVFDEAALEGPDGVQKILVNDYKLENIESVDCPADQEVEQGSKFNCVVMQGGDELTVQITVISDDGQYQVGLPEESK